MEDLNNVEEMIGVVEADNSVLSQEVLEFVTAVEEDLYEIELDQAFPAVGEANEQLRHSNLTGRDEPGQHIITSINGLREELDSIEALQTFYSDKIGSADYYLWEDGNPQRENRVGYFVSLSSVVESNYDENLLGRIEICDGTDIYGVTVSYAGFIGGQSDIKRDYQYGLVSNTGIVAVQCELGVQVGDCVLSNHYGMAKKSPNGYGYKVTAIENINGLDYAIVDLSATMENVSELADELSNLEDRVDKAETNVLSAMNVANEAYNLAISGSGGGIPDDLIQDVNDALQNSEDAMTAIDSFSSQITEAKTAAERAEQIAYTAVSSAETIRGEAVAKAEEALATVNGEVAEIQEKIDAYQSNIDKSIQEFDGTINDAIGNVKNLMDEVNGLSTNINNVTKKSEETSSTIQSLAALIDSHYVGSRSQAYGLSTAQMGRILDAGMIYVPTIEHDEKYACSEKSIDAKFYTYSVMKYSPIYGHSITGAEEDKLVTNNTVYIPTRSHVEAYVNEDGTEVRQDFKKGYVYTWNGSGWTESTSECVGFGDDDTYIYRYDEANNKLYVGTEDKPSDKEDTPFLRDGYINQSFKAGYYYLWDGAEWEQSPVQCVSFDLSVPGHSEYKYWYTGSAEREDEYHSKTLYFYNNNQWIAVAALGENVTNRIVSLIQQSVDENAAAIDLLVDYDKETSEAVAGISLKADENSAVIQNLTSYVNKYTVGDLSPADGFTIEEANNYFVSDVYYAPTNGHREKYGEAESVFDIGYLYTWNGNGWTKSETMCVYHGGDIPINNTYTHWYTGAESVADGYEKETLYMRKDNMWIAVATLDGGIAKATASIMQKVADNYATIESVTSLKTDTSNALALYKTEVSNTYAKQEEITSFNEALATFKTEVSDTYATQESVTNLETGLNTNLTSIKQQADENGASIQALVASLDQYSVGKYSQAYGLTYDIAKDIVKVGSIFVPTESNLKESYSNEYETEFIKGSYYEWKEGENGNPYWYEYTNSVFHQDFEPTAMSSYIYWFNTNTVEKDGYTPKALYKWEEVTTESDETVLDWNLVALLSDNSLSRSIASFRATQDSIAADVSSAKGDFASIDARITDTESSIQDVVEWKGENADSIATTIQSASESSAYIGQIASVKNDDDTINAVASIVAAVNNDTSGVTINADHINFEGFTIFATADDLKSLKESAISNTTIEYALSNSATTAPTSGWSTDSPTWNEGQYIWQRTTVEFVDDSKSAVVTTVCIQGAKGEQGNPGYTPQKGVDYFDGTDGTPGVNGKDGLSSYFHVKYSDDGMSFTSPNGETLGKWMGTCVDNNSEDPNDFDSYQWRKIVGDDGTDGIDGADGIDGNSAYFYVKFSANADGNPMSETPDKNTKYMGVCSTTSNTAPTDYSSYTWTQCRGNDGAQGESGEDGKSVVKVTPEYYCSSDGTASSNNTDWKETPEDWESGNTVFVRYRVDYDSGNPTYTDPQRDETFTTISDWCVSSDKTLINGANIATGTLSASQIRTGVLRDPNHKFEINLDAGTITMDTSFSVNIIAGASTFIKAEGATTYSPESITCTAQVSGVSGGGFTWYINNETQGNDTNSISVSPNHADENGDITVRVDYKLGDNTCFNSIIIKTIEIGIGDVEVNADIWEFVIDQPYITFPVDSDGKATNKKYTIGVEGYKNGSELTYTSIKENITDKYRTGVYYFEPKYNDSVVHRAYIGQSSTTLYIGSSGKTPFAVSSGTIPIEFYYSNGSTYFTATKEIYIHASKEDAIIDSLSFTAGDKSYGLNPANLTLAINSVSQSSATINADKISLCGYTTINKKFKIDTNGSMEATGGNIGGWTINETRIESLYTDNNNYERRIRLYSAQSKADYWITANINNVLKFAVQKNGKLIAKNAEIEGTVTASDGKIGGWTINEKEIAHEKDSTQYAYVRSMDFDTDGTNNKLIGCFYQAPNATTANECYFTKDGKIFANSGTIGGWTINTNQLSSSIDSNNYIYLNSSSNTKSDNWIGCVINGTNVFRVSKTGGIYASEGNIGGCTFDAYGNLVVPGSLVNGAVNSADSIIYGGTIGDNVSFAGGSGYLVSGDGYARLTSQNGNAYVGVHDTAVYMRIKSGSSITTTLSLQANGGNLGGTWRLNSSTTITSDRNKKNSIVDINGSYENLFDNLHPVLFKYNDGTSGRVHTGFISQDVCEAIENANLTTDDFAAYVRYIHVDEETSEVEEIYTLRYDEFIALNTWQIQKCKKRISDLEAKIEELINRNEE